MKKLFMMSLSDESGNFIVDSKTLIVEFTISEAKELQYIFFDLKKNGYQKISKKISLQNWILNMKLENIEDKSHSKDYIISKFDDIRKHYSIEKYPTISVSQDGILCISFSFLHTDGLIYAEIDIQEVLEKFQLSNITYKFDREEFMNFWRSELKNNILTPDDRIEVFLTAPLGVSDISKENLDILFSDYNVGNLKVVEIT